MSLSAFSQIDTTSVKLTPYVAKEAIKDILRGDGYREELEETSKKINLLEQVAKQQDTVISLLETKDINNQSIISLQEQQLTTSLELSNSLEKDIRKLKTKVVLWKGTALAAAIGFLLKMFSVF